MEWRRVNSESPDQLLYEILKPGGSHLFPTRLSIIRLLLGIGAKVKSSHMHAAIDCGDEALKALIEHGGDIAQKNSKGETVFRRLVKESDGRC